MSGKVFSAALGHFLVLRASPGFTILVNVRLDKSAATGDYWVQFFDLTAEPAVGADTSGMLFQPQKILHTNGIDDFLDLNLNTHPIVGSKGVVVAISSTEFTYTAAGAVASMQGGSL